MTAPPAATTKRGYRDPASVRRTTAMAILIPTTSAWKKLFRKGRRTCERDKGRARPLFSAPRAPTVLRRPSRRAQSLATLAPTHPPDASRMGVVRRAGRTRCEGAEHAHPATGPPATATRREIERDGEVSSRSRSRPAHDDHCSRSDSYDRIMMAGIGIGNASRRKI